jgi:bifunctional non-homologous end joining protein LigD
MAKLSKLAPPPSWIEPCIPTLVEKPPSGPNWRHEAKWDGYRVQLHVNEGAVKVRTRKGLDWTPKFPSIAVDAAKLKCRNALIDGEAVVLDAKGRPDFSALQAAIGNGSASIVAFVFDLLFLDGRNLRALPLAERRQALEKLVGKGKGAILLSEETDADGMDFFKAACAQGLEGMVSKRLDSRYRSGRHMDWVKVKCVQADEFVIVGYMSGERSRIAHLMLATEEDGDLRYVGAVGTGWTEAEALALKKKLDALAIREAAVVGVKARGAVWTVPELRAKVAYRGWTSGGELRQASFKGLRADE